MDMMDRFLQMRFPEPFRIGSPVWPPELKAALEKLTHPPAEDAQTMDVTALLKGICTELFRLREKMQKPGTDEPEEAFRRPYRHLEAVWDFLEQSGVQILSHTGARYEPGLELEVISYEPTPGIAKETVVQTFRPTVYYRDRMIQRGQVVVGKPPESPAGGDISGSPPGPEPAAPPAGGGSPPPGA